MKITIEGADDLIKKLDKKSAELSGIIKTEVNSGLLMIETRVKELIQRGAKTGKVYRKYKPKRTHRASAAGEAPATDTGSLVSQMRVELDSGGLSGAFVSGSKTSSWLEYGHGTTAPRPYMRPAYNAEKPIILKRINNALRKWSE